MASAGRVQVNKKHRLSCSRSSIRTLASKYFFRYWVLSALLKVLCVSWFRLSCIVSCAANQGMIAKALCAMKNLEVKFSLSELEFRCKNLFLIWGKHWEARI